jgi:hypothetical protein
MLNNLSEILAVYGSSYILVTCRLLVRCCFPKTLLSVWLYTPCFGWCSHPTSTPAPNLIPPTSKFIPECATSFWNWDALAASKQYFKGQYLVIVRLIQLYIISIIPEWYHLVPEAINYTTWHYIYQGCPCQGEGIGTGDDRQIILMLEIKGI